MSATLTTVNGILKEVYEGQINDQLQSEKVTSKRIETTSEGVFENAGGKYVVFPVRTKRNAGISYRSENASLAAAGKQGYASTQETLRYGYGRVRLTGQVMSLATSNPQAFANAADKEMTGLKDDLARDQNRIFIGHPDGTSLGATGVITRCTGSATSTTVQAVVPPALEVGMIIDIIDTGTGLPVTNGAGLEVTSAEPGATTFVVSGGTPVFATGNAIVRTGNWNKEPYGILDLVGSTGTVHNINSSTAGNEYWKSQVDSTTTTLDESAMIKVCDGIRTRGGKRPSAVFCSLGVRRAYFNLLTSLRRYNEPKEWTGGLVGLAFNYEKEIPVVSDIDIPTKHMIFVTESEVKIYRNKPWYWADDDGSVLKYVHDYDAFEGLMKQYWQVVTHQRNAHGKMTNITEA